MSVSEKTTCPYCPGSTRPYCKRGLKIHIGHKHKDVASSQRGAATLQSGAGVPPVAPPGVVVVPQNRLQDLPALKKRVPVLRHIPKGARGTAAARLSETIERCLESNSSEDWATLLCFAYSALKVPDKTGPGNLTTKVKRNVDTLLLDDVNATSPSFSKAPSVIRTIEAKVHEGDLRGAVRLLTSNDSIASFSPETMASLQSKHPSPSRQLHFPPPPDRSCTVLTVKVEDVAAAVNSFYNGSSSGLDGIRPGHLKELTSGSAGDNGPRLLESLTRMCNFLLSGQLNPEVCPYIYGASLCALKKKDGGIRPIAIGSTFRRLTAKLGCSAVRDAMADHLQPHQLGFGTRSGCEAAIHATRTFASDPANADCIVVKLDVRNAFNSLERDLLLSEVQDKVPTLYPFLHQVYQSPSNLYYEENLILSQVGAQQGDPLGPLIFSLAIQNAIVELDSPLNIWYLDDGTLGGRPEVVERDIRTLLSRFQDLGLVVNSEKCEFYPCSTASRSSFTSLETIVPGLQELDRDGFYLLGSPIFPGAVPEAIENRRGILIAARSRLQDLSAHVALLLLRMCFAVPKVTYLLRTSPTWLYPESITSFDATLMGTVESILNVELSKTQWRQASLPIRFGGLGVRRVCDVSVPAFLASVNGVTELVAKILSRDGDSLNIPHASDAEAIWLSLNATTDAPANPESQRSWDEPGSKRALIHLTDTASGADLARLKAVSRPESGAWLQALPSPHLGTLLDNDSMRVAVALRLGCNVCEPHICICGTRVEANGHHGLSCQKCSGRCPRHHALNDIIRRSLISANLPCRSEPPGLSRTDGKRPDGLTLVPWKRGRCLLWDATCVSTFAPSHLKRTIKTACSAAEGAAKLKHEKYAALEESYFFVPFAVETTGCWCSEAMDFIREIGRRIRQQGGDPRSGAFLMQRLSIAIQRGNAASIMGTFASGASRGGLFD